MHPSVENYQKTARQTLDDALVNLGVLNNLLDETLTRHRPDWVPCRAGCSWCCWQMNEMVSWIEAAAIFNAVREWDAGQKAGLVQRAERECEMLLADPVIAKFAEGSEVTPELLPQLAEAFRKHIRPCAFLKQESGECSIYEVRPQHCRVFGHSVVMPREDDKPAFYGCSVAREVVDERLNADEPVNLFDVSGFLKALYVMAGAPHVFALPLAFWVREVARGEEWGIDNPAPLFERFLAYYKPMKFEAVAAADAEQGAGDGRSVG